MAPVKVNPVQSSSLSSLALKQADAFRLARVDSSYMKGRNLAVATLISGGAAVLAVFETSLSAFVAVVTSPGYFIIPERYTKLLKHTTDSAQTALDATKYALGVLAQFFPKTAETIASKINSTQMEKFSQVLRQKGAKALQFGKDHKLALAAAVAFSATAFAAYYFGPQILESFTKTAPKAANLPGKATVTKVLQKVGSKKPLQQMAQTAVKKGAEVLPPLTSSQPLQNTTPSFQNPLSEEELKETLKKVTPEQFSKFKGDLTNVLSGENISKEEVISAVKKAAENASSPEEKAFFSYILSYLNWILSFIGGGAFSGRRITEIATTMALAAMGIVQWSFFYETAISNVFNPFR